MFKEGKIFHPITNAWILVHYLVQRAIHLPQKVVVGTRVLSPLCLQHNAHQAILMLQAMDTAMQIQIPITHTIAKRPSISTTNPIHSSTQGAQGQQARPHLSITAKSKIFRAFLPQIENVLLCPISGNVLPFRVLGKVILKVLIQP